MDSVIPHETILVNLTEFPLQFAVEAHSFTIPSLNPGGEHLVNSSEILKISRRLGSASWPIKVLNDEKFSGLKLEGRHFLDYVLIAFKFRRIEYEKYILVAEGVKEKKGVDMFLRMGRGFGALLWRSRIWKRRNFEVIAKAPPEYAKTMSQMRNSTTGDTTLTGSILVREGRVSPISGQYMEDRESYHHPDSTHSSSMDSFDYIFLRGFGALLWRSRIWKRRNFEVTAKAPPEYAKTMSQMRNTTTGDTTMTGSIFVREGRVSRISGQSMEDRESYHHPDSTHSSSMDSFDYIFLFVLALLLVSFLKLQQL